MTPKIKDLFAIKEEIDLEEQEEQARELERMEQRPEPMQRVVEIEDETEEEIERESRNDISDIRLFKEKRKYFKYENGRVIYMEPNKDNKWKELTDGIKDKIGNESTGEDRGKDREKLKKIVGGTLIILMMILLYVGLFFMLGKEDDKIYFPANTGNVVAQGEDQSPTRGSSEKEDTSAVGNKTPAVSDEAAIYTAKLKEINTNERNKVRDYLTGISNRGAVLNHIQRAESEKKKIYEKLGPNTEVNTLIVNSLAMSQEFLSSFNGRNVKVELEKVLAKYE